MSIVPTKSIIKQKRKELLDEFASGVTLHGFRFLFEGKSKVRRILWFLLTSGIFIFSFFLFRRIVNDFIGFKLVTSLMSKYEILDQVKFPTLTICPLSSVSGSKLSKSLEKLNVTFETLQLVEKYGFNHNKSNLNQSTIDAFKSYNISAQDIYKLYTLNYTEMTSGDIIQNFERPACLFYDKICTSDDFKLVKTWYGTSKCFQFNYYKEGKGALRPKSMSALEGLNLLMDLQCEDSYLSPFNLEGIAITVTPYGGPTKTFDSSKYIIIKPGEMAVIKLKVKKVRCLSFYYIIGKSGFVN